MNDTHSVSSVTGVALNLRVVGPGGRSYAFIIDLHIRFIVALAWFLTAHYFMSLGQGFNFAEFEPPDGYYIIAVIPATVIYFLYHPVLEIALKGQTPGKRVAGIRIVNEVGTTPGAGALLVRNVFRVIDSLPTIYLVGLFSTMMTKNSVRVGDMAAGTLLVYANSTNELRQAFDNEPDKVSSLTPQQQQVVSELLSRWPQLDPGYRQALAWKLLPQLDPSNTHSLKTNANDDALRMALKHLIVKQDQT
ncbi:MAG: hypothetical protein DHS20C11_10630 [Lysobacteraceae bacterium]|nr:MAG: hypothetical protein DHS20C11_10630 [Xanthomonadaceae bacterium]